jgi:hypothetical protein
MTGCAHGGAACGSTRSTAPDEVTMAVARRERGTVAAGLRAGDEAFDTVENLDATEARSRN